MHDDFDAFVNGLQASVNERVRSQYGEKAYERWRRPCFLGAMANPDAMVSLTGGCGDTMTAYLRFQNGTVSEASFTTDGCGSSAVCGSFAAELARGKNPDELMEITGEAILDVLGGFPEEDRHCAFLAADTLHAALDQYMRGRAGEQDQ